MRRISPREARRLMSRMGVKMESLEGVEEVIIRMSDRELVIEDPNVTVMEIGGQRVFQVVGNVSEREVGVAEEVVEAPKISEEDAMLLASQTGVSVEEAKEALRETGGNLAEALMLLRSRRK